MLVVLCASDKAKDLTVRFEDQIMTSASFFLAYYDFAKREFESCYNVISYLADLTEHYGDKEYADGLRTRFNELLEE